MDSSHKCHTRAHVQQGKNQPPLIPSPPCHQAFSPIKAAPLLIGKPLAYILCFPGFVFFLHPCDRGVELCDLFGNTTVGEITT